MSAAAETDQAVALLSVRGVGKGFGRRGEAVDVLHDISFDLAAGETLGLVGPSGAGKSTVARIVVGLTAPDTGTVTFRGNPIVGRRARHHRRHGGPQLIFQDPYAALAPGLPVVELVAEPLAISTSMDRAQRRDRALASLEEVRLTPAARYADRYPHELSGGERQRVALARALVLRPPVIVADEPTQMLDAALRTELLTLMRELQAEHGMAYLYVTHNLALAQRLCDRLAVMDRGRIVEIGLTDSVLRAPEHDCTAALVSAVHRLQRPLERSAP